MARADINTFDAGASIALDNKPAGFSTAGSTAQGPQAPAGGPGKAWQWNGLNWSKPNKPAGNKTYTWDDDKGWVESIAAGPVSKKAIGTAVDPATGDTYTVFDDGSQTLLYKGTKLRDAKLGADTAIATAQGERQSAYDLLYQQFDQYGLGSLVAPLKDLIISGSSPSEFTIKLRETEPYKKRFAANAARIKNGFKAIDEATYLGLEDKYQSIMQNYGLPESYYSRGEMGIQKGFEDLIGGNVDPVTLEERIMQGQKVLKGSKEIKDAISQFYPGINNSDLLAYVLDPKNALSEIKRKVTAAEIGGAQLGAGLAANVANAELLGAAGVTGQGYQRAASTIAGATLRGGQLAAIYGESPYTQQTAEQLVLNVPGSTEALKTTEKIGGLERATFGKKTGLSSGALARDRAGAY